MKYVAARQFSGSSSASSEPWFFYHNHAQLLLTLIYACLVITLVTPLMVWVVLLAFCAVLMRLALYSGKYKHAPSVRTINLLSVLAIIALVWFSRSQGLLLTMVNLLLSASALKLMMMHTRKDFLQLVVITIFILGCGFIFSQGLIFSIFYALVLTGLLLSLALYNAPSLPISATIKKLTKILLQALPVTVLLFLFAPQLPPLWQMPTSKSAQTGLTDRVTPGDIAELSRSDKLAFTATFDNDIPSLEQRYWRALSLENFDGKTWSVSEVRKRIEQRRVQFNDRFEPEVSGIPMSYSVITEASGQPWLFALDIAKNVTSNKPIIKRSDFQLMSQYPLMNKLRYSVTSYLQAPLTHNKMDMDARLNLQLPALGNPKTRAWVADIRSRHPDNEGFIRAVQRYFIEQNFTYTLSPPRMPNEPIDAFLFDHKTGFCVHYAGAMTFILRTAGIPARMVTGYLGGEELQSNVLMIRQFEAHAWVEAILDGEQWQRFDPTALVSPLRLSEGLQSALEANGEEYISDSFLGVGASPMLAELQRWMIALEYNWSRYVLGFSSNDQQDILKQLLGELTQTRLILFALALVGSVAFLLAVYFYLSTRSSKHPKHVSYYLRACRIVASICDIQRQNMTVDHYLAECESRLPSPCLQAFTQISECYKKLEYSADGNSEINNDGNSKKQIMKEMRSALSRLTRNHKAKAHVG